MNLYSENLFISLIFGHPGDNFTFVYVEKHIFVFQWRFSNYLNKNINIQKVNVPMSYHSPMSIMPYVWTNEQIYCAQGDHICCHNLCIWTYQRGRSCEVVSDRKVMPSSSLYCTTQTLEPIIYDGIRRKLSSRPQ